EIGCSCRHTYGAATARETECGNRPRRSTLPTREMVFTAARHHCEFEPERLVAEATNRANEVLNGSQMHVHPIHLAWNQSRPEYFDSGSKRERPRTRIGGALEEKR